MTSTVIFFDGVSGIGKTTFLHYIHTNFNIPVHNIRDNMDYVQRNFLKELDVNSGESTTSRLFFMEAWLNVCGEIISTYKSKGNSVILVDRSPVSTRLYNNDYTGVTERVVADLLSDFEIKTVLCDGVVDHVRKNKNIKKGEKVLDHFGKPCDKMLSVWRKARPFGKEWDYIFTPYKDRLIKKRQLRRIGEGLGVKFYDT
jgi:hypothetical protein